MKLIINIDEEDYKEVLKDAYSGTSFENKIFTAIANGTPISDNDCNSCEKAWTDKCERAECYENNYKHWTPYQKGNK